MAAKPRYRLRPWLGVALLAALVVAGALLYLSWSAIASRFGTGGGPVAPSGTQSAFQTKVTNGQVEFEITYGRDVTGVVRVTVTEPTDGTLLWVLSGPGQGRTPKIVYGVVPADGQFRWVQEWPTGGVPPPDVRGRRVKVRIETRFVRFGAGVEIAEAEIDVPKE